MQLIWSMKVEFRMKQLSNLNCIDRSNKVKVKKSLRLKKIKVFIFIFIIILIILSVIIFKNYTNNKKVMYRTTPNGVNLDDKSDGILNFSGMGVFFDKYTGELKTSDVAFKIEDFVTKKLPRIYENIKDYSVDELYIFYQNNQKSIFNMCGIDNSDDFIKFGKNIQIGKNKLKDYYRVDVISDTFIDESAKEGYAYSEFTVSYIDDSEINFGIYVAKLSDVNPQYIINAN